MRAAQVVAACAGFAGSAGCQKSVDAAADTPPAVHVTSPSVVGDLRLHTFSSRVYGNTRMLRVLLPDGYDDPANRDRHYSVLYLADGQNLFDPATSVFGPSEWKVDETVHQLVADHAIPPMIVVGVDDAGRTARAHEYLPYPDTLNPGYERAPQGKRYPDFLIGEVMPYINARYRTYHDAAHTGLGGSSYGGLISVYVVTARPGVFSQLLVESPTLDVYGDQVLKDAASVTTWPEHVYLAVGTNENSQLGCTPDGPLPADGRSMVQHVQKFGAFLHDAGLDSTRLRVTIAPCATHTHGAWAARLPAALTFLYAPRG